jgi:hypothetical protein
MAAAAVEAHGTAVLGYLQAIAVQLRLMQPPVAGGHFLGADWAAGLDEAELGHSLRM